MKDEPVIRFIEDVRGLRGTWVASPVTQSQVDRVEAFIGVRLPPTHRALLLEANGIHAAAGYERLFGVGDGSQDIGPWNAHGTWKFAWPIPLDDYLAIGQSGWGDQYAYRLSELRQGLETIHRLDHFMMHEADVPMATSFVGFLQGFLACAYSPDERVLEAHRQIGELARDELAVFCPSPLLVGLERATQLTRMGARDAMVQNGDMTAQLLDPECQTYTVAGFDQYFDELGRRRFHVRWARPLEAPRPATFAAPTAEPELPWM